MARAPEVIILADHSTGASTAGRAAPEKWQRLISVPAIQAGRLHSADLSILHRYGPRVPDGLETLARFDPSRGVSVSPARRLALRRSACWASFWSPSPRSRSSSGSAGLSPRAVARALAGRAGAESVESIVTLQLRLPRVLAAVLAGGALAVAGVAFQGLTRNPLAEPAVLGVSSGAAFGVVLGPDLRPRACRFCRRSAWPPSRSPARCWRRRAVYLIAVVPGGLSIQTLLLAGVIVGIFFTSAITVLISVMDFNRLGGVIHWLLGNLAPIPARLAGALRGPGARRLLAHPAVRARAEPARPRRGGRGAARCRRRRGSSGGSSSPRRC